MEYVESSHITTSFFVSSDTTRLDVWRFLTLRKLPPSLLTRCLFSKMCSLLFLFSDFFHLLLFSFRLNAWLHKVRKINVVIMRCFVRSTYHLCSCLISVLLYKSISLICLNFSTDEFNRDHERAIIFWSSVMNRKYI